MIFALKNILTVDKGESSAAGVTRGKTSSRNIKSKGSFPLLNSLILLMIPDGGGMGPPRRRIFPPPPPPRLPPLMIQQMSVT